MSLSSSEEEYEVVEKTTRRKRKAPLRLQDYHIQEMGSLQDSKSALVQFVVQLMFQYYYYYKY